MAVVQVLNSKAQQGLNVFRKNFGRLKEIKPSIPDDALKSVDSFARSLDLPKGSVTKRGKFTQAAKDHIAKVLKRMGLPETATWQDVVDAGIKIEKNAKEALDAPLLKATNEKSLSAPVKGLDEEAIRKIMQRYGSI